MSTPSFWAARISRCSRARFARHWGKGVRVVSSAEETTRELTDILSRRGQLAGEVAVPEHRFATTSDNIAEFAAAGSFIFGRPLRSIEHVGIDELEVLH